MDDAHEPGFIKLPISMVVSIFLGLPAAGVSVATLLQENNNNQLSAAVARIHALEQDLPSVKDTARTALQLASESGRRADDNRRFFHDRTEGLYFDKEATADQRKQEARDAQQDDWNEQQDRRLTALERDIDRR